MKELFVGCVRAEVSSIMRVVSVLYISYTGS